MFMFDAQLDQSSTELYLEPVMTSSVMTGSQAESDDYQALLTAADAARAGLASDEHDYDYNIEEDVI